MSPTSWRALATSAALAAIGACWTGSPPTKPPAPPTTATTTTPSPSHAHHRAARPPDPADAPSVLAAELRKSGPVELPMFVDGPLLVLDLDALAVNTLCGTAAEQMAARWGARLADPGRPAPTCAAGYPPEVTCMQYDRGEIFVVYFESAEAPRVTGAMIGSGGPNFGASGSVQALLAKLRAQTATATCP